LNPFFSIVIPTYNRSALLLEAIQSILDQTFRSFEIIIVDDGGTDDTEHTIQKLNSDCIKYFEKVNGERGAARNLGIDKSIGEYVVFLDSDDRLLPDHLETLYSHLRQKKEDFIATKFLFFDQSGKTTENDVNKLIEGYHGFKTFLIGNPIACCFTIRRDNPSLIRFREELFYVIMEDWIFLMENLQINKLYLINKVTITMRDHEQRSMRANAKRVVSARISARTYLLSSLMFSEEDRATLLSSSNYFCAIHSYLAGDTSLGFQYLWNSVKQKGFSVRVGFLFVKLCIQKI